MTESEIKVNALLRELADQRSLLGDRCASLAAANAILTAENVELKKQIDGLEKP